MIFTYFDFSVHTLKKVKKNLQKLIIIGFWLIAAGLQITEILGIGPTTTNHPNIFLKTTPNSWQVSWPNNLQFKF